MKFGILIVAGSVIGLAVLLNGHFNFIHRFQEWRYERKVDNTQEWQAFKDAFEVQK
jgi:uncharacterized membrane protein HdeD (DUF308 family)